MDLDGFLDGLLGKRGKRSPRRHPPKRAPGPLSEAVAAIARWSEKWEAHAVSGARCAMLPPQPSAALACGMPAIDRCVACGRETCVAHSFVAPGYTVCVECVLLARVERERQVRQDASARSSGQQAPRRPERDFGFIYPEEESGDPIAAERAKNLRLLELKPTATDEEVQRAYKRLALEHHPDRASAGSKEHARKRMIEINAAFAWLREHREAAA